MHKLTYLSAAIAAVVLAGCAEPQDGSGEISINQLGGHVVDGRVANGKVWADRNNDGTLDDFEPFAWTDSDGFYSYNPETQTNYCALANGSDGFKHCLQYGSTTDEVVIRVRGGIDVATGEPLKGSLAMATTQSGAAPSATPLVVSPLTTLLERVPAAQQAQLKTALGISDADLKKDYTSDFDGALYANAVAMQSMLDIAANAGGGESAELAVIAAIAEQMVVKAASGTTSLTAIDATDFDAVLTAAGVSDAGVRSQVASRVATLNTEVAAIASGSEADAAKRVKALEVVTKLINTEVSEPTSNANNALTNINSLVTDIVTAVTAPELDIEALTDDVLAASASGAPTGVNTLVGANQLKAQDWTSDWFVFRPSGAQASDTDYIAANFDSNGQFSMCLNIVQSGSSDGPSTEKAYYGGTWSAISDSSITMVFNISGIEAEGVLKARDSQDTSSYTTDMDEVRLTSDLFADEAGIMLIDPATPPTSLDSKNDAGCATLHNSITLSL